MTHDEPLCMNCKNYEGCRLCKEYGECPEKIFSGEDCKKYKAKEKKEREMRRFLALILVLAFAVLLVGCSEGGSPSNTDPKNLYAIIALPNGDVVEGKVKEYHRYNEGCIEIHIGKNVYYIHSARVALLETPKMMR